MRFRVGQGFDFHRLETGRKLVLGGVEIEHSAGLRGHSDADVAAHALANAILGAIGEGDLGQHFPDNDPRYLGADSIALLRSVWQRTTDLGWSLVNADITIVAAQPRLAPYLPAMRVRLATALGVEAELLNVKASHPESLGCARSWRRDGVGGNRNAAGELTEAAGATTPHAVNRWRSRYRRDRGSAIALAAARA